MAVKFDPIGVVGAGAWGTALAHSIAMRGTDTVLWAFERDTADAIRETRSNPMFLPGVELSSNLRATNELSDLSQCRLILLVPPAQHLAGLVHSVADVVSADVPLVVCSKGIEKATNRLLHEVMSEAAPGRPAAFLSGPSFAAEVARGLPAALTVACLDQDLGKQIAESLGSQNLRLYWTEDIVGVEIGGAAKNVLAIAAGIVVGRQLGANAHAALVTRGFAEMRRLAEARGGRTETLAGLSGLGDLLLTCGSPKSRNMSLGVALGEGRALADVLGERNAVTEGVHTAAALVAMADELGVDVPLSRAVLAIVDGEISVDDAISRILQRPLKPED